MQKMGQRESQTGVHEKWQRRTKSWKKKKKTMKDPAVPKIQSRKMLRNIPGLFDQLI